MKVADIGRGDWGAHLRVILATFAGAAILFAIHVYYGRGWAIDYVNHAFNARHWTIFREPYPPHIFWTAFITEMLPMLGKVAVYLLLQDRLPGRSAVAKGLWYGLLMLFWTDGSFRGPIMSAVVGNPPDVVFVQSLEAWLIFPLVGVAIAVLVQPVEQFRWKPGTSS